MPHKFKVPEHCSAVFTSTGEHRAKGGHIILSDGAPASDHAELRAAGCELVSNAGEAPTKAAPRKSTGRGKSRAKSKGAAPKPAPAKPEPAPAAEPPSA